SKKIEKKDYEYFEDKYGSKFYRLGYDMAAGKVGIGDYLTFFKSDLKEAFTDPNISNKEEEYDEAEAYASSLVGTAEWDAQVGELIRKIAERERIPEGTDFYVRGIFAALTSEWVRGYIDYILELKEKEKLKGKRVRA
ncbi:MAG: hypothetical protein ACP5L3_07685, partial [Caldisericum sp.]|uniref:hypothetical protein n=1 Tax=Caldisericum sp. TaxID=2499687 RepID=UPI003D0E33CB